MSQLPIFSTSSLLLDLLSQFVPSKTLENESEAAGLCCRPPEIQKKLHPLPNDFICDIHVFLDSLQ
ncbi:hypothetical protein J6590_087670, partial [Homalodisca vitripennis]